MKQATLGLNLSTKRTRKRELLRWIEWFPWGHNALNTYRLRSTDRKNCGNGKKYPLKNIPHRNKNDC